MKIHAHFKIAALTCAITALTACASHPTTPVPIPTYADGYSLPTDVPDKKARLLYELVDRSGFANLLLIKGSAGPTEEMVSKELQQTMDRLQTRAYASCLINEVRRGPSYFSLVAELDRTLTTKEIKTLLEYLDSSGGQKMRDANNQGITLALTPKEAIEKEKFQILLNKQQYAAQHFIHWLPFYNEKVKSFCIDWFKKNNQ